MVYGDNNIMNVNSDTLLMVKMFVFKHEVKLLTKLYCVIFDMQY